MSSDTSNNMFIIIVGESSLFKWFHETFCDLLLGKRDCFLHFRRLSSRDKRRLEDFYERDLYKHIERFEVVEIYVLKKSFRNSSQAILRIFRREIQAFKPDKIVLPTDFNNLIKSFIKKFVRFTGVKPIIDNSSYPVQVSDILINLYRRIRNPIFFPKAKIYTI